MDRLKKIATGARGGRGERDKRVSDKDRLGITA
jgi:hypothetical protein